MTRQRSGATRQSGGQYFTSPTPAEIGRQLRQAREEQGLALLDVHDRLERPITQLEALEAGDLAGLPDQAFALSTLRRYAALLTLDGDDLALRLMEVWTTPPAKGARRPRHRADNGAGVVTEVTSQPDHLRAFTQTGQVPGAGSAGAVSAGTLSANDADPKPFPAMSPSEAAHSKRAVARARRQQRAPRLLKMTTWIAALSLLVVLAGAVIQASHPRWLVDWHITQVAQGGTGNPAGGSPPGSATHPTSSPVRLTSATDVAETYSVDTSRFTVNIATSAPCWVQVNDPSSPSPLSQGIQERGQVEHYTANGSLSLEVGSSAALIGVTIDGKSVFVTGPKAAPFTYNFVGTAGTGSSTSTVS